MPDEIHDPSKHDCNQRHPVEVNINRSAFGAANFGFSSRFALKQALARNQTPNQRAHDCVERDQHLVRQENQIQQDAEIRGDEN